jgi:hypothetical protein
MFGKFFCDDLGLFAPLQAAAVTARQRIDRAVALMIHPHEIEPAFVVSVQVSIGFRHYVD